MRKRMGLFVVAAALVAGACGDGTRNLPRRIEITDDISVFEVSNYRCIAYHDRVKTTGGGAWVGGIWCDPNPIR